MKQYYHNIRKDITAKQIEAALGICEKKLDNLENIEKVRIYITLKLNMNFIISQEEWAIIGEEDMLNYNKEMDKLERMNKISLQNKRYNTTIEKRPPVKKRSHQAKQ